MVVVDQLLEHLLVICGSRRDVHAENHEAIKARARKRFRQRHAHRHSLLDRRFEIPDPCEVFADDEIARVLCELAFEVLRVRADDKRARDRRGKRELAPDAVGDPDQHEPVGQTLRCAVRGSSSRA